MWCLHLFVILGETRGAADPAQCLHPERPAPAPGAQHAQAGEPRQAAQGQRRELQPRQGPGQTQSLGYTDSEESCALILHLDDWSLFSEINQKVRR